MISLGRSELKALSAICANFSVVFLGSMVVPIFTGTFDINNIVVILLGLGFTLGFVALSLYCAKKGKL